jgi:hypothetical protein
MMLMRPVATLQEYFVSTHAERRGRQWNPMHTWRLQ